MRDRGIVLLLLLSFALSAIAATCWTTADRLMPGWGFYVNGESYGGTKPMGTYAAWSASQAPHALTWVLPFPSMGRYYVWVRKYGGYGDVSVFIDEKPLHGDTRGGYGGRYVWRLLGGAAVTAGRHHLDIRVTGTMFDAILLTTDPALDPETAALPPPDRQVIRCAPRRYRDDRYLSAAAGGRGYVPASLPPGEAGFNDYVPPADRVLRKLALRGGEGQYVTADFAIRALTAIGDCTISLERLKGPVGTTITASDLDLRVVGLLKRLEVSYIGEPAAGSYPSLLLRDDLTGYPPKGRQGGFGGGRCMTAIPAHESRQFHLTIHLSGNLPTGSYRGTLRIAPAGASRPELALPVQVDLLPVGLQPVDGYYAIYHPAQAVDPKRDNYVSPQRYRAELADQVRHGANAATLYGGIAALPAARMAGMTQPPVIMGWPDGTADVERAKGMGFPDLYYYGVDEPAGAGIDRCVVEAERRTKLGLHMFTAINNREARERLKDVVDRPVFNIWVFDYGSGTAEYARDRGFIPISYWTTAVTYPLFYRALTGLYNIACGYRGTAPWAYADYVDARIFGGPATCVHVMSYPDAAGEPIPTLNWEAYRDGVDDVRYLQALDRAIAAAEARLKQPGPPTALAATLEHARAIRNERFAVIHGPWFAYLNGLAPESLDITRQKMADAAVAIRKLLYGDGNHAMRERT